jgi:hypothetical protein
MMHKTIAVAALAVLLAACDGGADSGADGGTAEGEVLGGTISDEMLPLDTVRSQSPPLRTEPNGEGAAGEEAAEEDTDEPADAQEAAEDDAAADEDANADAPPQIQLNPAPAAATPETEGD